MAIPTQSRSTTAKPNRQQDDKTLVDHTPAPGTGLAANNESKRALPASKKPQNNSTVSSLPRLADASTTRQVPAHRRSNSTTSLLARPPPATSLDSQSPTPASQLHACRETMSPARLLSANGIPRANHLRSRSDARKPPTVVTAHQSASATNASKPPAIKLPFTAYQQQFSPRKSKLPSMTKSQPNIVTGFGPHDEKSATPRITRLQDELLQLSLVYEDSAEGLQQYEADVQARLDQLDQEIRAEAEEVTFQERKRQKNVNAHALQEWLDGSHGFSNPEKLSALINCIEDLNSMSRSDSPFHLAARSFDQWQDHVESIIASRQSSPAKELCFIPQLDRRCFDTLSKNKEKLLLCSRTLAQLGIASPDSAVGFLLRYHRDLAWTMLEEIDTCLGIIQAISDYDRNWTNDRLDRAIAASLADRGVIDRAGIWELPEEPG